MLLVTITADNIEQRIDNFLMTQLKGVPKSRIYRAIRSGEVRVNKGRIKVHYKLKLGDVVRIPPIRVSEKVQVYPSKKYIAAILDNILYETDALLVINKTSGMAVHGGSAVPYGVIEALRHTARYKDGYLELVHRLDRETSGCLLLAKQRTALQELHELLRTGGIHKEYITLVHGKWHDTTVEALVDNKTAVTKFKVLTKYNNATLMQANPITGRMHQIRVHALHSGHAIAGDYKHGAHEFNVAMRALGLQRLFLHAAALTFTLPSSGQVIKISANLPEELRKHLCLIS